jgi:DNA-binding response OmpR family regulator
MTAPTTDSARILIVEDEAPLREGLAERLTRAGYRVTAVETVAAGIEATAGGPDLVILDRRLPDGEGLEVLRHLRAQGSETRVIVLSARGMPDDRVAGLEDGADDYVTKPFHLRELLARVHNVLERGNGGNGDGGRMPFGAFHLDIGARLLRRGEEEISLTKLEFALLHYFLRHPDRAIPRTELLDRVWGYDRYPTTRTVDFHVLSLRRKIESGVGNPRHLLTVQGVGYRFEV